MIQFFRSTLEYFGIIRWSILICSKWIKKFKPVSDVHHCVRIPIIVSSQQVKYNSRIVLWGYHHDGLRPHGDPVSSQGKSRSSQVKSSSGATRPRGDHPRSSQFFRFCFQSEFIIDQLDFAAQKLTKTRISIDFAWDIPSSRSC